MKIFCSNRDEDTSKGLMVFKRLRNIFCFDNEGRSS